MKLFEGKKPPGFGALTEKEDSMDGYKLPFYLML